MSCLLHLVMVAAVIFATYVSFGGLWGTAVTNLIHCTVVLVGLDTGVPSGRKTGVDNCWKKWGRLSAITLTASWHRFDSDRLDQHYGNEVDLLATAKVKKTALSVRYAHYDARALATDTNKVWLQADWAI